MSTTLPSEGIPVVRFLANQAGVADAIGNYSAAVTDFHHDVPAGHAFIVHTMCVQISDNTNFNQLDYGAIVSGLTNGIKFFILSKGVEIPLLSSVVIKHNNDWARVTSDIKLTQWASTPQTLIVNLTPDSRMGLPLTMTSVNSERFIARLNDDFSGLTAHTFALGGILMPLTML